MIREDYYLSNFAFTFNGHNDVGRDEVELSLQSRFQGIHPRGVDYLFQARGIGTNNWLVNGTSPSGSRACASVCRGLSLQPVRMDFTASLPKAIADYTLFVNSLDEWFKKHKPTTLIERFVNGSGWEQTNYGTRSSRFSLKVEDKETSVLVTWCIRDRAKAAWELFNYVETTIEFREAVKNCFAACTNTYLIPDFFGLSHPSDIKLVNDKPADVEQDWWGFLSSVAKKITQEAKKQNSQHLVVDSVRFLEGECFKAVQREIKDNNEKAIRDRQAGLVVLE